MCLNPAAGRGVQAAGRGVQLHAVGDYLRAGVRPARVTGCDSAPFGVAPAGTGRRRPTLRTGPARHWDRLRAHGARAGPHTGSGRARVAVPMLTVVGPAAPIAARS